MITKSFEEITNTNDKLLVINGIVGVSSSVLFISLFVFGFNNLFVNFSLFTLAITFICCQIYLIFQLFELLIRFKKKFIKGFFISIFLDFFTIVVPLLVFLVTTRVGISIPKSFSAQKKNSLSTDIECYIDGRMVTTTRENCAELSKLNTRGTQNEQAPTTVINYPQGSTREGPSYEMPKLKNAEIRQPIQVKIVEPMFKPSTFNPSNYNYTITSPNISPPPSFSFD